MLKERRFIVSYILNNQPESIDIVTDAENFTQEDAKERIKATLTSDAPADITNIQIISIHHPTNPDVHPGHYQQPEGN